MIKKNSKTNGTKKLFSVLNDPDTWDRWRIQGKISLSRLAYSLVALFAVDTIIAATTKTLLHPVIAIAGLLWIVLVTAAIWYRGGVVIDALFGAEIINLEVKHTEKHIRTGEGFRPGHDFVQALALLGMIGVFITSFFLFVPIWQSWGLFLTLLVVLTGWRCAATLADSKFDWNKVRIAYIVFTVSAVGIIFLVYGHEFMTGQALTVDAVRKGLQGGIGKLIFWPILLIIVGMIPKVPLRGLIKAVGIIGLLAILFITFLFPIAKKELTAMGTPAWAQAHKRQPQCEKNNVVFRFPLKPNCPSELMTAPANVRVWFDGPETTHITNREGQIIGPLAKEYGYSLSHELQNGIRFVNPEGGLVTVTVVPH